MQGLQSLQKIYNYITKKVVYVPRVEDYWIDCKDVKDARKRQYQRLTLQHMLTLGPNAIGIEVPSQIVEDDEDILQFDYLKNGIEDQPIVEPHLNGLEVLFLYVVN